MELLVTNNGYNNSDIKDQPFVKLWFTIPHEITSMVSTISKQPKGKLKLKDNNLFKILQIFNKCSIKYKQL